MRGRGEPGRSVTACSTSGMTIRISKAAKLAPGRVGAAAPAGRDRNRFPILSPELRIPATIAVWHPPGTDQLKLQRHFVILRKSLRHYGYAKVITMRTVVAGPDCLAATTVQAPARWAGRKGNSSKQTSCEPLSLHTPDWWDELRMLGKTAPYQVCMLTATSVEAGAVTLTSNAYRAGSGAVIT